MLTREITVETQHGLHMRVASRIAQLSQESKAQIRLINPDQRKASGSSVLDMLTLGAHRGTKLIYEVEGPSENTVARQLEELLVKGTPA